MSLMTYFNCERPISFFLLSQLISSICFTYNKESDNICGYLKIKLNQAYNRENKNLLDLTK